MRNLTIGRSCIAVVLLLVTLNANALSILLESGDNAMKVEDRLIGLGHTVTVSDGTTWGGAFDYSPYDIAAFEFASTDPADMTHFLDTVTKGDIGAIFFRGYGAQSTSNALGLTAGAVNDDDLAWQQAATFNVTNNSHDITTGLTLGPNDLGFRYMSYVSNAFLGADVTVLGSGSSGAALIVHDTLRAAIIPFYGHSTDYDQETAIGLQITENALTWAADLQPLLIPALSTIPAPSTIALLGLGLAGIGTFGKRKSA